MCSILNGPPINLPSYTFLSRGGVLSPSITTQMTEQPGQPAEQRGSVNIKGANLSFDQPCSILAMVQ